MKGIVLAGGAGTRLHPSTIAVSKQLLPIYDKPMIYHPISVLMLAGIRDILIISTPVDLPNFKRLLGDGSQFGVKFSYKEQPSPDGLAQAFILGEEFIGDDCVALILGDNIFYGGGFSGKLKCVVSDVTNNGGATVFGYPVKDPQRFGVVEFENPSPANAVPLPLTREAKLHDLKQSISPADADCQPLTRVGKLRVLSIEEKPQNPKSNYAVTGLYFYDNRVVEFAKNLKPSARGELEITDLNKIYLQNGNLNVELLGRGFAWLDTGTHHSLLQAGQFVQTVEENQGIKIACLEEVAYRMGFVTKEDLQKTIEKYSNNEYFNYVRNMLNKL
jgi:glucose-1-phosphate thymidylyltransferase